MKHSEPMTDTDVTEAAAHRRIDELEAAFGPMADPGNPQGRDALLAADERGEFVEGAEQVLEVFGLNAEFVPEHLGGRLSRMDVLGRVLRPVFRRDASLGFGFGLNCFFAAVPVWTAGTPEQQRWAAWLLLGGERLAVARHEVAHGNDFLREEFTAERHGYDGYVLNGSKAVIANATRANGLVVFARTDSGAGGGRSHSVLLLDRTDLPPDRIENLSRHTTTGMRSAEFGGLAIKDCPVPESALLGREGDGYELSLRSSLLIRGVIPSIVLAGADTALRTVVGFATRRRSDGRDPLRAARTRGVLAGTFLDLLLSDCLALVATRALHLLPGQMSAYAAVATYLAPKVLGESLEDLSAVLGEAQYARDGDYGMFQKQLRDLPLTALGHAGNAGRQASIIPQLPVFARRSWFAGEEPPSGLFRLHDRLPPLDLGRLALIGDSDPLAETLVAGAERIESEGEAALIALTRELVEEFRELRDACLELDPYDRAGLASPHSFALADRYALLLAAAACLGVWHAGRDEPGSFLADPAWLTALLYRIGGRLGVVLPERPTHCEQVVLDEVLARFHEPRSYDLYGTELAG